VTNPCDQNAIVVFWTYKTSPTKQEAEGALKNFAAQDNKVPASADSYLIADEVTARLPFGGGFGIVRWEGQSGYEVFRLQSADVEPIPVAIPKKLCP
jgi:hypothetical protein